MIHLGKLNYDNVDDVFELEVKKEQYPFVLDNCNSLAKAYATMINGGKVGFFWISYELENIVAKKLYASFGFLETKEMCGDEIVAVMKL